MNLPSKSRIILPNRKIIAGWRRPIRRRGSSGQSYADAVLADSPRIWWRFYDATYTDPAADSSGNGKLGEYINSASVIFQQPPLIDDPDAFSIRGNADPTMVVRIGDGISLADSVLAADSWSFEYWLKPFSLQGSGGDDNLVQVNFSGFIARLHPTAAGRARCIFRGIVIESADNAFVINQTYHVVVTFDRTLTPMRAYMNGVLVAGPSGFIAPQDGPSSNLIFNNAASFDGQISDLAVYNTALSLAQIQAHYTAGTS